LKNRALEHCKSAAPKSEAVLFGVVWNCLDRFLFDFHLNLLWLCLL
jgi:hypothetical protein